MFLQIHPNIPIFQNKISIHTSVNINAAIGCSIDLTFESKLILFNDSAVYILIVIVTQNINLLTISCRITNHT